MASLNLTAGLKFYENELISSIQQADSLLPLTKKANEAGLIPQEVNDNLKSMDPDVDHPLKCRYLMLYVYKTLARKAKFEKWLELLSRHGIDSSVLAKVKNENGALSKIDDFTFKECHVSILTELLANCADKWEDIADSLNFKENEVQDIQEDAYNISSGDVIKVCFRSLLLRWVTFKERYPKPTLKSIEEVLRSETVGLGYEANNLQECFMKSMEVKDFGQNTIYERKEIFEINSQTRVTKVKDEKSVLFEVKVDVGADLTHPLEYQWYKNEEENMYEKECILCLPLVDLTIEGSYTCKVTCGDKEIVCEPIVLTVVTPLDQFLLIDTLNSHKYQRIPGLQ